MEVSPTCAPVRSLASRSSRPPRQLGAAISEYLPIVGLAITILLGAFNQFGDTVRSHGSAIAQEIGGGSGQSQLDNRREANNSYFGGGGGSTGGGDSGGEDGGADSGGSTGGDAGGSNSGSGGSGDTAGTGGVPGAGDTSGSNGGDASGGGQVASGGGGGGGGAPGGGSGTTDDGDTGEDGNAEDGETDDGDTAVVEDEEATLEAMLDYAIALGSGVWDGVKEQVFGLVNMVLNPIDTARDMKDLAVALYTEPEETLAAIKAELKEEVTAIASGDPYAVGKFIGENASPAVIGNVASRVRKLASVSKAIKKLDEGCSSFIAGTPVWTPDGFQPIERLRVGDAVWARSDRTFATEANNITHLMGREVERYIELDTGAGLIHTTEEHPFWRQGGGWTKAKNLEAGQVIAAHHGDLVVHAKRWVKGPVSVYNFTVEKNHTYFVGPHKLWVHNAAPCTVDHLVKAAMEKVLKNVPESKHKQLEAEMKANETFKEALLDNPELATTWDLLDDAGVEPKIRTDVNSLGRVSHHLKDDTFREAAEANPRLLEQLAKHQGTRDLPHEYLDDAYITGHIAKFEGGASALVFKGVLDSPTFPNWGRDDGLFVMPKDEMDLLLQKTGGDIRKIEIELGIPPGNWADKAAKGDILQRVDLDDAADRNLRMPSGNEAGADPLEWRPGGTTPGGWSEAVVEPVNKGDIRPDMVRDVVAKKIATQFEQKIEKQMNKRGWDRDSVNSTIENPDRTAITRDTRWHPDGTRRDDPATAYIREDGHYVVRNDNDGTIVQFSDRNAADWKSPFE